MSKEIEYVFGEIEVYIKKRIEQLRKDAEKKKTATGSEADLIDELQEMKYVTMRGKRKLLNRLKVE